MDRLKAREREYLELRSKQIMTIAEQKREKETKKKAYLAQKAAQRAQLLREKHEKAEAWEKAEDQRTQANLKKEHARDQLMLEHIENLRAKQSREQAEAAARKKAALEERKAREDKESEELQAETVRKSVLEQKRNRNIATREALREQKNQRYCEYIRDLKTAEALRSKDQEQLVLSAREKT